MGELLSSVRHSKGEVIGARNLCVKWWNGHFFTRGKIGTVVSANILHRRNEIDAPSSEVRPSHMLQVFEQA